MITLFKDPKTWLIIILAVFAYYGFMCGDNSEKEAILEQDNKRLLDELKTLKKGIVVLEDSLAQQKRIDTVYIQTRKIIRDENAKENIRINNLAADTATVFVPTTDSVWTEIHLLARRR